MPSKENAIAKITIAIGSTNPVKVAAVETILRQAMPYATFMAVSVPSQVSEQPWGDEETRQGAYNRALAALKATEADFSVGLEGGLKKTSVGVMTCAWCAICNNQGQVGYGGGANILLPPIVVNMMADYGELGPVMDKLIHEDNTKQRQGAIGILTNGLSNRQQAYEQLVALAVAPFVTDFYQQDRL